MKRTGNEFPPPEALLSPEEIAKLIVNFANHSFALGFKAGYVRGRDDQREGNPWLPGTEKIL